MNKIEAHVTHIQINIIYMRKIYKKFHDLVKNGNYRNFSLVLQRWYINRDCFDVCISIRYTPD